MINLRYHIVSITAVFLALGIGVTLGSTMIQRYTIDTLEDRLDELGTRLDRTDGENAELRTVLSDLDERDEQLAEQTDALLAGHLDDTSVLVVSVQGTDGELLSGARSQLRSAGAEVAGTLVFSARWQDLSDSEVDELAEIVGRRASPDTLARSMALSRVAAELSGAAEPAPDDDPADAATSDDDEGGIDGAVGEPAPGVDDGGESTTPTTPDTGPAVPGDLDDETGEGDAGDGDATEGEAADDGDAVEEAPEAEIITALIEAGWLEFVPDGASEPFPRQGMRLVVVADDGPAISEEAVLIPLLESLTGIGPAPVVVAAPIAPRTVTDDGDDDEPDRLASLVRIVRDHERLSERVTTVDALGHFVGNAALVLALGSPDDSTPVHLGLDESAERLLPAGTS